MARKVFTALSDLKQYHLLAMKTLGEKYNTTVTPFVAILQAQMQKEDIDVFSAMKKIKGESFLYKKEGAPIMFAAAVVEIVEQRHFADLPAK